MTVSYFTLLQLHYYEKEKQFTAPYIPNPGVRWRSEDRFMPHWLSSNTKKVILGLHDVENTDITTV
jgi:hypothetical protein